MNANNEPKVALKRSIDPLLLVQNSSIARARGNPLVQLQLQLVRVVSNSY